MKKVIGRECRNIVHLEAIEDKREDTHVISEILHYEDGTKEKKLTLLKNYQRPFWITKEHYRNHEQKKEAEDIEKLDKHYSTVSELGKNIAIRLGKRYIGRTHIRDVIDSPYVYGIDVTSGTLLRNHYHRTFPDFNTPWSIAVLDFEADPLTGEVFMVSLVMSDKIYTVVDKNFYGDMREVEQKVEYLFQKYVPDCDFKNITDKEITLVDNDLDVVLKVMDKAHKWMPDIIAVWNISYDIQTAMLGILHKYDIDPAEVFSDPSLPKELKYFKFKEGPRQKLTESGKFTPVPPHEQWHYVFAPAHFIWIDAMSTYNFVRVGGKNVPGGYSLDNILEYELKGNMQKLKFGEESKYKGVEWHLYMQANKKLEYTVYNQWDCGSIITLDDKTKDLKTTLPMFSGDSGFELFNSSPKRIVEALHFFYEEHGQIPGCKGTKRDDDKILGLANWIVLLPSHRVAEMGIPVVFEGKEIRTNTRSYVFDADCVSSYPSDGLAANVSRDTTKRKLINIKGIKQPTFMKQNINLFYGKVNDIEWSNTMLSLPTLSNLYNNLKDELEAI